MRCGRLKLTAVDGLLWSVIHATDEFFIKDPNEGPRHDLVLSLPVGLPTVFSGWSRAITIPMCLRTQLCSFEMDALRVTTELASNIYKMLDQFKISGACSEARKNYPASYRCSHRPSEQARNTSYSDGSGTATTYGNATISSTRLVATTKWLGSGKKQGTIGEFTGALKTICEDAPAVEAKL